MTKEFKILPNDLFFHTFQKEILSPDDTISYLNLFYITDYNKRLTYEEITNINSELIAFIEFYTNDDTDEANITSMFVHPKYRGKGYAFYLLLKVFMYLKSVGIQTVCLDDTSDKYRQHDNIYVQIGFRYVSDAGPEMFADIKDLLHKRNFTFFKNKWSANFHE